MRGGRANPPVWAVVLQQSKQYGIPPWEFEKSCTAEWWRRIITYETVMAEERERLEKKKRGKKPTRHRSKTHR